jgi:hypothetical protein
MEYSVFREILLTPCESKEHLYNWFKFFLDVDLFNCKVHRFSDSCPMDAAWELYDFAMRPKSKSPESFLYASSRSTQKTLLLSAVEVVLAIHSGRSIIHYAAVKEQIKPAQKYMSNFAGKVLLRELLISDPTQYNIWFYAPQYANEDMVEYFLKCWREGMTAQQIYEKNPEAVRKVLIELVGISGGTTQGKHESIVSVDEVSSLKGEKILNYQDIKKVPIASFKGDPHLTFKISTRRGAYSVVEKEIASKDKTGLKVRKWTVFEGIERCPDKRSGTDFVHERMVSAVDRSVLTHEEFKLVEDKKKKNYQPVKFASGCLNCPLASVCMTDAKKQTSQSKYLQSIEAAIADFIGSEVDFYNSQCLSLEPSKEGQVFPTYDPDTHFISADEMYEKFTGQKPNTPQNIDSLVRLFRSSGLRAGMGLDWGHSHPLAWSLHFHDDERCFTVKSFAATGLELHKDVIPMLREVERRFGRFKIYPDPARPDNNQALITEGFDVYTEKKKDVDASISTMRNFLKPNYGEPRWYLLQGECSTLNTSMKNYHYIELGDGTYSDVVDKVDDDDVDAARYFFYGAFTTEHVVRVVPDFDSAHNVPMAVQDWQRLQAEAIYKNSGVPLIESDSNPPLFSGSNTGSIFLIPDELDYDDE